MIAPATEGRRFESTDTVLFRATASRSHLVQLLGEETIDGLGLRNVLECEIDRTAAGGVYRHITVSQQLVEERLGEGRILDAIEAYLYHIRRDESAFLVHLFGRQHVPLTSPAEVRESEEGYPSDTENRTDPPEKRATWNPRHRSESADDE